ncbi:MAG: flippase activity-associated protein Agl23 [Haloferacaceae archaeon]
MRREDRTTLAVGSVAALALVVRLVGLGDRVMHFDEARVAYWALRYHETGQFSYRPIVHGPFLQVVNDWVFTVLPPTDFSARLVVALVGGLLPLAALALRGRLRDDETVALALVLAANPLLLYYSRFMRNDVLVAAFCVAALLLVVRALDTGRAWPAYLGAVALALGFASKENALVYVLCFGGAGFLLLDHRLVRRTAGGESPRRVLRDWADTLAARLRGWGGSTGRGAGLAALHAAGWAVTFLAVVAFFYAPRPQLWTALGSPAALAGVVGEATVGSAEAFVGTWVGGTHQSHPYLPYVYDYLETLVYGAPAAVAFAAVGFVIDGYADEAGRRDVVAFATYWGLVSVLGYPVATDIRAPWAAVHAVVPLALPAAVGLAALYRRATTTTAPLDGRVGSSRATAALAALVVIAAVSGVAGANAAYHNSAAEADGEVLQYAQPGNGLKTTLSTEVRPAIEATDDGPAPDVLYYGTTSPAGGQVKLYVRNESSAAQPRVGGPNWHSRLPLPWYFEVYGAEVTSTAPAAPLPADPPPVVVAMDWDRAALEGELPGYEAYEHRHRLWGERVVIFVDRSAARQA